MGWPSVAEAMSDKPKRKARTTRHDRRARDIPIWIPTALSSDGKPFGPYVRKLHGPIGRSGR